MADLARRATRWVGTFPYILTPIPNLYDHSFPRYGQITFLTFRRPTTLTIDLKFWNFAKTRTNTQTHKHKQTDIGITIPRPPPMGGEVMIVHRISHELTNPRVHSTILRPDNGMLVLSARFREWETLQIGCIQALLTITDHDTYWYILYMALRLHCQIPPTYQAEAHTASVLHLWWSLSMQMNYALWNSFVWINKPLNIYCITLKAFYLIVNWYTG